MATGQHGPDAGSGAAIWIAGAVGVACGTGDFVLAGLVTGIALVVVVVFGFFEHRLIYEGTEKGRND